MASTYSPTTEHKEEAAADDNIERHHNIQREPEQQTSAINQLLQIAEAASGAAIQIPADILTSLLQSLNGFRSIIVELKNKNEELQKTLDSLQCSIVELNKENQGLRQEQRVMEKNILRLQINSGLEFALFPKLPLEIQRMVWRHCSNVPQIVALEEFTRSPFRHLTATTTGRHCLLEVCKEARREALHKIFSLQPHRSSYINGFNFNPATPPPPAIFFNSNVDTIWIDPYNHYPDGELIPYLRRYSCYGQKTTSIRKLAIGYETWHRMMLFGMGNGDLKSMQHLAEMGTEEVFLIVGDTVKMRQNHQILF